MSEETDYQYGPDNYVMIGSIPLIYNDNLVPRIFDADHLRQHDVLRRLEFRASPLGLSFEVRVDERPSKRYFGLRRALWQFGALPKSVPVRTGTYAALGPGSSFMVYVTMPEPSDEDPTFLEQQTVYLYKRVVTISVRMEIEFSEDDLYPMQPRSQRLGENVIDLVYEIDRRKKTSDD